MVSKKNEKPNASLFRFFKPVFHWWWVAIFVFSISLLYKKGAQAKTTMHQSLMERLALLEDEMEQVMQDREELLLRIDSQKDPTWVEMVLMRDLGVVPEGQTKVLFVDKSSALNETVFAQ